MKNLIVPTDFSANAQNGIDLAIILARKQKSKIYLIHVIPAEATVYVGVATDIFKKVEDRLAMRMAELASQNPDLNFDYQIGQGRVYKEVVRLAESIEDSVIVTSTHGETGMEQLFIGSNAYKIISATTRPVISIREAAPPKEIKRILMPIDLSKSTRQKVPFTIELAKAWGADIHILTVASSKEDLALAQKYSDQVQKYIEEEGIKCQVESLMGDNLTDVIVGYAKGDHAQLISIMTEQDEDLSNLILGTYAHQMLNKSELPVLSITPKEFYITDSFHTQG